MIWVSGTTIVHRGCMSDAETTPGRISCTTTDNYCLKCPTNGCNNTPHLEQNPLFCVSCNSATNPNCEDVVNGTFSARCDNRLLGRTTQCFANYEDGSTVRGCTNDVAYPCNSPTANCELCNGANCNVEDYCLSCSTATEANCRENTIALEPQLCRRVTGQRGCYRREQPGKLNSEFFLNHFNKLEFYFRDNYNQNFCKLKIKIVKWKDQRLHFAASIFI